MRTARQLAHAARLLLGMLAGLPGRLLEDPNGDAARARRRMMRGRLDAARRNAREDR